MYMSGIKVPKLGSIQDRIFREYLNRESNKEVKKNQLLALLVINSLDTTDSAVARDWSSKVQKVWNSYIGLEYGVEIPEQTEKELQMMDYYIKSIKDLKPKLKKNVDGTISVLGLGSLIKETK